MREILFRGKRLDTGEWVEGFYDRSVNHFSGTQRHFILTQELNANGFPNELFHNSLAWFEVDPDTVGQFTGVTDKNGKKVFEHDIVRFDGGTFVVVFVDSRMGFCFNGLHGRGCVPGFAMAHWEHLEVIGNIHDQPKLLGGAFE